MLTRGAATVVLGILCVAVLGRTIGAADIPVGFGPYAVAIADLNADGKADIVTANYFPDNVSVLLGNGDGTFAAAVNVPVVAGGAPQAVAIGDVNGDGKPDIVTGNFAGGSVNGSVSVLLGNGDGTFPTLVTYDAGGPVYAVVLADLNGDGKLDIATANGSAGNVSVLLGNGNGTFQAASNLSVGEGTDTQVNGVAVGDLNGDGKLEIVTANARHYYGVSVLSGSGDGTFPTVVGYAAGTGPSAVAVADLNGDTKLDVAVTNSMSNNVSVLLNNGDGTLATALNASVGLNPTGLAVGDLNGDGKPDIVTSNYSENTVTVLLGKGDGTYQSGGTYSVGSGPQALAVGQLNADSQMDIVTADYFAAGVRVLLLNPTASITTISPDAGIVNMAAFTLTVTGSGFVPGSTVQWKGANRTTTYVSAVLLTAAIPASDLTAQGKVSITVANPAPGGFPSNSQTFYLYPSATGAWVVTNTNDAGTGSLRFAMEQVRAGDTITFDPVVFDLVNANAETVINVLSALPALAAGNVTIDAQDRRVTLNGAAAGAADGLLISSNANRVHGLTICGFPRSGVRVANGARDNILGGDRDIGKGVNGQGLRIGQNGAFGIHISGAGSSGNLVRGCWLGLDASGTAAEPNLSGVLIAEGAAQNVVGGTTEGEANVISGNSYEGITVGGAGSDDNHIKRNYIGVTAVAENASAAGRAAGIRAEDTVAGRAPLGNGSTGVFLSKGTKRNKVGGQAAGEGNVIGFNGGNGLEVRAADSQDNSATGNSISANLGGGIGLFDGSNRGVTAPGVTEVARVGRGANPGMTKVRIRGTASAATGNVEVFTDPGIQGRSLVGRAGVSGGAWEIEVDVSDVENITATLTDANGSTSPFAVFGRAPQDISDTDADGVSNTLEDLAGTSKTDASDTPVEQGAVVADKLDIKLNFTALGRDALKATMRLSLPDGYTNEETEAAVMVGGASKHFTLDEKGRGKKGSAALKVTASAVGSGGLLQYSVRNGDLRTGLAAYGLTDKTTAGETVTVPLAVAVKLLDKSYVYVGTVNVLYKAVQGKKGAAKKAQ